MYQILFELSDKISAFNVFRYITFRSFLSFFTAFLLCWSLGPYFIQNLKKKQRKQSIREDGPLSHLKKQGTPTMGGTLILMSIFIASLLWVQLTNPLVLATVIILFSFGAIGYVDDYLKVKGKSSKGLSAKWRLILEFAICISVFSFLLKIEAIDSYLHFPFFKNVIFDLKWFYPIFASFVIVGCANAVNLTDGLDGLALVPIMVCASTLLVFSYLAGHAEIANYLNIPYILGAGQFSPLITAVIASTLGFLWFNTYPAQVFMGDVGSLSLGSFLGTISVMTKNELILVLLGGVFVFEALSVIVQVTSFKLTGKRVFKMTPIHHHFELKGIEESKIIVRFWIIAILLAVISLSTLKLR